MSTQSLTSNISSTNRHKQHHEFLISFYKFRVIVMIYGITLIIIFIIYIIINVLLLIIYHQDLTFPNIISSLLYPIKDELWRSIPSLALLGLFFIVELSFLRTESKIGKDKRKKLEVETENFPLSFKPNYILPGHAGYINSVAWSPDGSMLASGSDDKTIRLWSVQSGQVLYYILTGHTDCINSVAWSPDGSMLASGSDDKTIRLWNTQTGQLLYVLMDHTGDINSIAWSPDELIFASGSDDKTIRLWNAQTRQHQRTLEGHTNAISYLAFSPDTLLLASISTEGVICFWWHDTWERKSTLYAPSLKVRASFAFHPELTVLAILNRKGTDIHVCKFDIDAIFNNTINAPVLDIDPIFSSTINTPIPIRLDASYNIAFSDAASQVPVSYANAKVVLVGESGVGKSGLGLVLSGQRYKETDSTHGRQVWTLDHYEIELDKNRKETHETFLWDLAGQPGYRLIHQLYLNEITVALVVFDARSETDPFAGVEHWTRALAQAQRIQGSSAPPLKKLLVAARADRGGVGASRERIQSLVQERDFDRFFETSAKEGWQIAELREAIHKVIDWKMLPRISSSELFQSIKDFLYKEKKEARRFLSGAEDLYRLFLKSRDAPLETADLHAQFETCIGRLESVGLIKRLNFGNLVLLQPELLDAYASALVHAVKDEPDGLGNIPEVLVRAGNFRMPQDERLKDKEQEKLLLIAMVEDLLRHELILREDAFLVFPSQSTRENPDLPDPEGKAIVYSFEGPVLNIYATLAVRLANSGLFKKKGLWKNAITYTASAGGICGMFLHNSGEGRSELTLFFDPKETASEQTRFHFEEYVQIHLQRRALSETIRRRRIFVCDECDTSLPEHIVQSRRARGFDWLNCPVCGNRISLLDREQRLTAVPSSEVLAMDRAADSKRDLEAAKTSVQGKEATKDFDVFLCHNTVDKPEVKKIGEQLKEQGILPWLDEWELRPGLPWQRLLEEQIKHIKAAAVFVGSNGIGPWQRQELDAFLRKFANQGCPVIPVLLEIAPQQPNLPVFLEGMGWVDFRQKDPDSMERLIWGITGERRRL